MDPQSTLWSILAELSSDEPDRDEVRYLLMDLASWIRKGGYLPSIKQIISDPITINRTYEITPRTTNQ